MNKSAQKLSDFRNEVYQLLGTGKDATFDLMDAVLTTRSVCSFAELSLSPVFRRKWPNIIYEAIDDVRPKTHKLMKLYLNQIPTQDPSPRPVLVGDHTPWPRTEAPTLRDRTYEHETPISRAVLQLKQVCRHLNVRPITIWDSEYGCAPFIKETAEINADKLIRTTCGSYI